MNNNDSPKWASWLSADVKASMAQAAEDRKESAKKFEQAIAQAAEDRKNFANVIKVVVESAVSGVAQVFAKELAEDRKQAAEDRKQAAKDRQMIADKLDEIIRLFKIQGNGRGNGHSGNGRKR